MPIDASIPLQVQPIRVPSPMEQFAQVEQLQGLMASRDYRTLQTQALARDAADTAMYRQIMQQTAGAEPGQQAQALRRAGLATQADAVEKSANERLQSQATLRKTEGEIAAQGTAARKAQLEQQLQTMGAIGQVMSGVKDQPSYAAARQQIAALLGPQAIASIPEVYDPAAVARNRQQALTVQQQMEQEWKRLEALRGDEQLRISGRNADSASRQADAAMVAAGQVPVQYVQTENGILPMPSRLPNPGGGAPPMAPPMAPPGGPAAPGMPQPGAPAMPQPGMAPRPTLPAAPAPQGMPQIGQSIGGKPLENPPEGALKAARENNLALRKIDDTLSALGAAPGAIGPQNMIPGVTTVRNWTGSPEDIRLRALVADVGSLKIHDRSGAAVTVSEYPRLAPFVPSANDLPHVARAKLSEFQREYRAVQAEMAAEYTRERGYKPSPTIGTAGPAPGGASGMPSADAIAAELRRRGVQ